jgi:hypothetical protein
MFLLQLHTELTVLAEKFYVLITIRYRISCFSWTESLNPYSTEWGSIMRIMKSSGTEAEVVGKAARARSAIGHRR